MLAGGPMPAGVAIAPGGQPSISASIAARSNSSAILGASKILSKQPHSQAKRAAPVNSEYRCQLPQGHRGAGLADGFQNPQSAVEALD